MRLLRQLLLLLMFELFLITVVRLKKKKQTTGHTDGHRRIRIQKIIAQNQIQRVFNVIFLLLSNVSSTHLPRIMMSTKLNTAADIEVMGLAYDSKL